MTTVTETTILNYSGLSTDTKPTTATGGDVPNGSRWREVDTARVYHYNRDADAWYETGKGIDDSTHAALVVDYAHHEVHGGSHFFYEGNTVLGAAGTLFFKMVVPDLLSWVHMEWKIDATGLLTFTMDEDAAGGMAGGAVVTSHGSNRNANAWTGLHDGAGNAAILTDSSQAWTPDALIGYQVFNTTDGSSGVITNNDVTTVTATLAGGTDNDWDANDAYEINKSRLVITRGVTTCTSYIQRVADQSFGSNRTPGAVVREDEIILKQNTVYCISFTSGAASNTVNFKANWYEHTAKS